MILLNTNQISKASGVAPLFRNVSLSIGEGDRLGLIGPNGSGKSTLLQMLAGHIAPDSGYQRATRSDGLSRDEKLPARE